MKCILQHGAVWWTAHLTRSAYPYSLSSFVIIEEHCRRVASPKKRIHSASKLKGTRHTHTERKDSYCKVVTDDDSDDYDSTLHFSSFASYSLLLFIQRYVELFLFLFGKYTADDDNNSLPSINFFDLNISWWAQFLYTRIHNADHSTLNAGLKLYNINTHIKYHVQLFGSCREFGSKNERIYRAMGIAGQMHGVQLHEPF